MITEIYDSDQSSGDGPEKNSDMRDDMVDRIIAEPAFVIQEKFSIANVYNGFFSSIELRSRISCDSNYYGSVCGTFCLETNNESGHYVCDINGNKICTDGYKEPRSNCTEGLYYIFVFCTVENV